MFPLHLTNCDNGNSKNSEKKFNRSDSEAATTATWKIGGETSSSCSGYSCGRNSNPAVAVVATAAVTVAAALVEVAILPE